MCSTLKKKKKELGLGVWHSLSLGQGSRFYPQDEKRNIKKIMGLR